MKGVALIVFDGNISSVSLPKSPDAKYTKSNADLLFPISFSFLPECQDGKVFAFYVLFVCEREALLFFLMNLLTGPALALRSSQFEISTYHSSHLH